MAQLDDANYATYYEYDQEGNLIRIKKETEMGIVTLQENRQHLSTKTGTNIKLNIKKIKSIL